MRTIAALLALSTLAHSSITPPANHDDSHNNVGDITTTPSPSSPPPGLLSPLTSAYAPLTIHNYGYLGCYTDMASNTRLLSTPMAISLSSANSMTLGECVSACAAADYAVAGISRSNVCWCGTSGDLAETTPPNRRVDISECDDVCTGNGDEVCGGGSSAAGKEGEVIAFVSVYSANEDDCFWNGTDGRGVFCDTGLEEEYAPAAAQVVARDVEVSTSSYSYATAAYSLPPSAVFMAPVSTQGSDGYSPAVGGSGSGGQSVNVQDASEGGYLTVENGATCRVLNVVVVTTNATMTVSAPSTGSVMVTTAGSTVNGAAEVQISVTVAPSSGMTATAISTPTTSATYSTALYALPPSQVYSSGQPVGSAAYLQIEQEDASYSAVY